MSFFSSSPQPRFTTDEGLEDFIRTKTPGKTGSPSKISSINNSMGDHQNRDSPLKHADLSPVYRREQNDSIYSSNPASFFPASPVPKIMVTEAMKIGSGRKSKENGILFSPDLASSQNENPKKVVIISPPKKRSSISPKKENIQRSPHRLAEMYSSPSEGPESKRKSSTNEDQHSQHVNESPEVKKPLEEVNISNTLRNPPATSYAGMPQQKNLNTSTNFNNETEQEALKQQRASLPASPGDRNAQFEQPVSKFYSTTHSPKLKLRRDDEEEEEPIIIQDTPTARKTIEFPVNLEGVQGQEGQGEAHENLKTQDFDLRRYRGENEAPKKAGRQNYESNRNPSIQEVSSRVENLESSIGTRGGRNSHNVSEHMPVQENLLQVKSEAESPTSHRGAARMNHSRISSRHSDRSFDSRIENWTVDNFTMFPGTDPQKAAEIQDRANNIIKTLRKSRDKFFDIIFLPNLTSLVNSVRRNKKHEWKALEWMRLSEIYKQLKPTLYEEISPLNIKPGLLKNYDFQTVVATLAEYPEIVRNLIHNQAYNTEGCYSVKVCRDGAWKSVVVDDLIPVVKESNKVAAKPAFLRIQNDDKKIDIWPQIYEKAWAKVFDTYQNLEVTSVDQMLRNSLGAPCTTHEIEDQEQTWTFLSEAFTQGHIVIAGIRDNKSSLSNDEIYKKGLNPLYGNTVLDISLTAPSEARTITLRNIWNDEYAWESKHNSEAAQKEKIITMTLQEFCSIYTHLYVSQYNENYVYRSTTMRHVQQAYSVVKFRCETGMESFFETVQIDHRFYRGDPSYQYSNSRLLIFKLDGNTGTYIGGSVSDSKCNTLKINLAEGDYYIIGNMDWKDKVNDFTLSSYSSGEIKFERVHYRENPELLSQLLEGLFTENGIPKILLKNKDFVKYEKVFPELNCKGELFINNSSAKTLHIHKKVSKIQNANLLNEALGENNDVKITLLPQTSKVFLFGAEDLTKVSTYISEDIVYDSLK